MEVTLQVPSRIWVAAVAVAHLLLAIMELLPQAEMVEQEQPHQYPARL